MHELGVTERLSTRVAPMVAMVRAEALCLTRDFEASARKHTNCVAGRLTSSNLRSKGSSPSGSANKPDPGPLPVAGLSPQPQCATPGYGNA